MMPPDYWQGLAADYATAYEQAFGCSGAKNALVIAMSCAEHETNNGRAWPGTNNFGAVQLRALTPAENTAFHNGTLKESDYTPSRDGVLHVDTHPTAAGPVRYPVWFAAFPTRPAGIAWFLKTLYRLSGGAFVGDGATCATVAEAMYMHGYYEGAHGGARPVKQRAEPLTPPEQANVNDYAGAMQRCRDMIEPALVSFMADAAPSSTPAPAPGQEAGEAGADEGLPGNEHTDTKAV